MIVEAQGKRYDLSGSSHDQRIQQLNDLFRTLFEQNEVIQEIVIDGISFHQDYNPYLIANAGTIQRVDIHTTNGDLLIQDIVTDSAAYAGRLVQACDSIGDMFYGDAEGIDWNHFTSLMDGIAWLIHTVTTIRQHLEKFHLAQEVDRALASAESVITQQLTALEDALAGKNYVEAGDRIKFELSEQFESVESTLKAWAAR